ncbi:hypothetical protein COCOBI_04-0530 [Coccomyxa sp. Obi]|nr:hypothetical protein COCOBI_04-0530 [Coccomyxa sp. Obi]
MPLHLIYSAKGVFSPSDKEAIAQNITNIYGVTLPKFYVVVVFVDVDEDSIYVGGKPNSRFVRLVTQHLAREKTDPERAEMVVNKIQNALAPYVHDRGLDWETHVEWMDREGWRENGLRPPMPETEAEKLWKELDKPVPY